MRFLVPVGPLDMPAVRTGLRGVPGVERGRSGLVHRRLVRDHLAQLIEGPGYRFVTMPFPHCFCGSANPGQILKHKQSMGSIAINECLTDSMVHIGHPTGFSLAHFLKSPAGGRGLPLLQFPSQLLVMGAAVLNRTPLVKNGVPLRIVGGEQKIHAKVDPHHLLYGVKRCDRNLLGSRFQTKSSSGFLNSTFVHACPLFIRLLYLAITVFTTDCAICERNAYCSRNGRYVRACREAWTTCFDALTSAETNWQPSR